MWLHGLRRWRDTEWISRRRILGCARNAIISSPSGFGFMNINARLICIMSSYCSGIETLDRIIPVPVFEYQRDSASEDIRSKIIFRSSIII